jgi:Fe2+ or Zn2+ uptake regulation protein
LKKIYPKVGKSTIYRNVEEMTKIWVLTKLIGIQDKAIYELTRDNHIHLIDRETWYIKDLYIDNINIPLIPYNFTVDFMNVDIYGKFK